jgi:hypothetical protein
MISVADRRAVHGWMHFLGVDGPRIAVVAPLMGVATMLQLER